MKIENLFLVPQATEPRPAKEPVKENFAETLKNTLACQAGAPEKAASPAPVPVAGEVLQTATALAEAVLSRLEILQTSLGRADISLKKMMPLIQKLEQDCLHLQDIAQDLPEGSPLRQLLKETASLAWVETFKFHRGDYL